MKPAPVTDSLLHDLVMTFLAEGTDQMAVAAAVTLGERILLCGHDTGGLRPRMGTCPAACRCPAKPSPAR